MKKAIIFIPVLAALVSGCYNDKYDKLYPVPAVTTATCDTTSVSYARDIAPIISTNCAITGCHNASGDAVTGNLDYTIFTVLKGDATQALLVNDIEGTPTRGHNAMPLNLPSLGQCDINKLVAWVNQGAQNN